MRIADAFNITYHWNVSHTICRRYYNDTGYYRANGCLKKRLYLLRPDDVEKAVYEAMKERLEHLKIAKKESEKPDKETGNIKAEILRTDDEIKKLMDKLANADSVLFDYINERVKTLHIVKTLEKRKE